MIYPGTIATCVVRKERGARIIVWRDDQTICVDAGASEVRLCIDEARAIRRALSRAIREASEIRAAMEAPDA